MSLVLRLAQILIGVALVFLSSRVLIKPLDGQLKLITAILCAQLFGYLMVWSNTKILKSSGELGVYKKLKPIKIGHLILPVGSIAIGFGFYSNRQSFVLIGGCIFFVANYLLTRVEESQFLKIMIEVEQEKEEVRVKDLDVSISSEQPSQNCYAITIKNTGNRLFKNLRVGYEKVLLDAENFGIDTTHMPTEDARISGEPIFIEKLSPAQSIKFVRNGWGSYVKFDGRKKFAVELDFETNETSVDLKKWCYARVKLPNARS